MDSNPEIIECLFIHPFALKLSGEQIIAVGIPRDSNEVLRAQPSLPRVCHGQESL